MIEYICYKCPNLKKKKALAAIFEELNIKLYCELNWELAEKDVYASKPCLYLWIEVRKNFYGDDIVKTDEEVEKPFTLDIVQVKMDIVSFILEYT